MTMITTIAALAVLIFFALAMVVGVIGSVIDKWHDSDASIIRELAILAIAALLFAFVFVTGGIKILEITQGCR